MRIATSSTSDVIPGITLSTVETVHGAFPHIPLPNLIYSLSKTRSGQTTSEEIIERGSLPTVSYHLFTGISSKRSKLTQKPPTSFQIPSYLQPPTVNPPSAPSSPIASKTQNQKSVSLIEKYGLTNRIPSRKGKEVDMGIDEAPATVVGNENASGWSESREMREKALKERKERMILEARR